MLKRTLDYLFAEIPWHMPRAFWWAFIAWVALFWTGAAVQLATLLLGLK